MSRYIDLHVHSTYSDGSLTPTELVREALAAGLSALALTDHDSVGGIQEFMSAGRKMGLETVPGVELSTEYADEEIHVLGLFIDPGCETLLAQLATFRDKRDNRNLKMIEKLREVGFSITEGELRSSYPDSVIARPHMARYLAETGQAPDAKWVFDHYIAADGPCYVERYKITPMEAVKLIHEAAGVAILAHPCMYKISRETLLTMIEEMKAVGLDGIEAIYSCNKEGEEDYYRGIAEEYGLLISGGSDFHGATKPDISLGTGEGNLAVPYLLLYDIKKYRCTEAK